MKPEDYVLTSKGKLGQIVLPGINDPQNNYYEPASVAFGKKVYEIWPENLQIISHVTIKVLEGEIVLTAQSAANLIKVLLRNRLPFEIIGGTYSRLVISDLEKELFGYETTL